jgi:hypothetical protein
MLVGMRQTNQPVDNAYSIFDLSPFSFLPPCLRSVNTVSSVRDFLFRQPGLLKHSFAQGAQQRGRDALPRVRRGTSGNRSFADLASDLVERCPLAANSAMAIGRRTARTEATVVTEKSRKKDRSTTDP